MASSFLIVFGRLQEHDMEHTFYSNIRGSTDKYAQMKKGQKIEVFAKVQGNPGTQVKLKTKYKDKVQACGKIIFFRQQVRPTHT